MDDRYSVKCSSLRIGGYVVIRDRPCKIVEMSISKTGKHGHAKAHIVGIDIFNGRKYDCVCPTTHDMEVPNVTRTPYTLLDITEEGYVSLMSEAGEVRDDLLLPDDDVGKKIRSLFQDDQQVEATVTKALGEEKILSFKKLD